VHKQEYQPKDQSRSGSNKKTQLVWSCYRIQVATCLQAKISDDSTSYDIDEKETENKSNENDL